MRPTARPVLRTSNARIADTPKPHTLDHTAIIWVEHIDDITITRAHASLRFDAPVTDVVDYLHAIIVEYRPAVLETTEAEQRGIVRALRKRLGRHYGVRKCREYLCIVDRSNARHRIRRPRLVRMTRIPGLVDWRNLFVGEFRIKLLADPKIRYVAEAGHVASGVQHGASYRTDRPELVAANRDGLAAWGRHIDNLTGTVVSAAMDSNLDQHLKVWRDRTGAALGGPTIWDQHQPAGGTHAGGRLIETAVLRHGGPTPKETP
jgi:hypothetical protein